MNLYQLSRKSTFVVLTHAALRLRYAAPQSRQSPDGFITLLPLNEAVQLRLRYTAPALGASPHKKIDMQRLIFK